MAIVHDAPKGKGWLMRLLTTDFCPGINRFVYWLKEPVGWFISAAIASASIGQFVAPIGWTIAASLLLVVCIGILWPWFAVRSVQCSLYPETKKIHEGDTCKFSLSVLNRFPIPVWGIAIEGFLDHRPNESLEYSLPSAALAFVPGMAKSIYGFKSTPQLRGHYPVTAPQITCSFPFGIWTASRPLHECSRVTVWPRVFPIVGQCEIAGRLSTNQGEGHRQGSTGDFIGVRDYRHGDGIKQVNWIATAKTDRLIVTERNAPQCPQLDMYIDVDCPHSADDLSDRMRVAASILANLHQSKVPMRVHVGRRTVTSKRGDVGLAELLDLLAEVPASGMEASAKTKPSFAHATVIISSNSKGNPVVCVSHPEMQSRSKMGHHHQVIDRQLELASQLAILWAEQRNVSKVA